MPATSPAMLDSLCPSPRRMQVPISAMLHSPSAEQLAWLSQQALSEAGLFLSQTATLAHLLDLLHSSPRFVSQLSARGALHLACGPGLVDPALLAQLPAGCRLRVHLSGEHIAVDLAALLAGCRELHISVPFSFRGCGGVVLRLPGPPVGAAALEGGGEGGSRGSDDRSSSGLQAAVEAHFLSSGASLLSVTLESLSRGAGAMQGPCRFVRFAWDGIPAATASPAAAAQPAAAAAHETGPAAATPEGFVMGRSLPLPDPPPSEGSGGLRQGWMEPLGRTWAMRRCTDPATSRPFVRQELCSLDPGRYSFSSPLAPANVAALKELARPRELHFAAGEAPATVAEVLGSPLFCQRCGGLLKVMELPLHALPGLDLRPFTALEVLHVECPAEGVRPGFWELVQLPPGLKVLRLLAASRGQAINAQWLQGLVAPRECTVELKGFSARSAASIWPSVLPGAMRR